MRVATLASIEDAHAALLRHTQLQFDFRDGVPKPIPPEPWHWSVGSDGVAVVWVLAGAAALIVLVLVARYLTRHLPAPAPAEMPSGPDPLTVIPQEVAALALGDADGLAARGRFLDAAHVLLACGITEIRRRYPAMLRPAHTSRDIAALPGLPDPMRAAFGRIAAAVERGLFGGSTIGPADYADCRRVFVASALASRP